MVAHRRQVQKDLGDRDKEVQTLRKQVSKLQESDRRQRSQLEVALQDRTNLNNQLVECRTELDTLRGQLDESKAETASEKTQKLLSQRERLAAVQLHANVVVKLKEEFKTQQSKEQDELRGLRKQVAELEQQIEADMNNNLQLLKQYEEVLSGGNSQKECECEQLKQLLREESKKYEDLNYPYDKLMAESETVAAQKLQLETDLQEQAEQHEATLAACESKLTASESARRDLEDRFNRLKLDVATLKNEKVQLEIALGVEQDKAKAALANNGNFIHSNSTEQAFMDETMPGCIREDEVHLGAGIVATDSAKAEAVSGASASKRQRIIVLDKFDDAAVEVISKRTACWLDCLTDKEAAWCALDWAFKVVNDKIDSRSPPENVKNIRRANDADVVVDTSPFELWVAAAINVYAQHVKKSNLPLRAYFQHATNRSRSGYDAAFKLVRGPLGIKCIVV
jgi:chromosome segregation ATPase